MEIAVFLSVLDENSEHARASLESLDRTLPPRWSGRVTLLDHTTRTDPDFLAALPRPDWRAVRAGTADRHAVLAGVGSEVLCFVQAGTILLPGWLPPLLGVLRRAAHAGCVGNIQREPYSGLIEHAGIGFNRDGLPVPVGRNLALLPPDRFDRRAAVSPACWLVRRGVFERLGGFDVRFQGTALGGVDFCLRAAEAGCRHYVANRSVVYHYDDAPPLAEDPDLPLYRARWGDRARECHARRERLRRDPLDAPFSPERWEMTREARRTLRLEVAETRAVGRRYLTKHWHRPWRYNAGRVSTALGQALQPLPALVPLIPAVPPDTSRPDDGWLFDPPPQP